MILNPLDRPMFTNMQQRRNSSRMPQGILASGPRIMNAAMQQQFLNQPGPILDTDGAVMPANYFGFDQYPGAEAVLGGQVGRPGAEIEPVEIPSVVVPAGENPAPGPDGSGSTAEIGTLDEVAPDNQPAPTPSEDPKPKPEQETPSSERTMKSIMDKIAELRGTADKKKTKSEALKEAKDFLKEAGVDGVDDIRTSRDFMLMTLGLNIATGGSTEGGLRGVLEDTLAGSKETLGTYGALKAAEKKDERAINLAAAEMAQAEIAAQRERGLKLDELEIEALTKQLEQQIKAEIGPDELQIARALMEDDENLTLADAITITKAQRSGFKTTVLDELKRQYPNANQGQLALIVANAGYLKQIVEEQGFEGLAKILGVTSLEAEKIASQAGAAAEIPDQDPGGAQNVIVIE